MTNSRAAVVLGASGSVGHALIAELMRSGGFRTIVTLVRRRQPEAVLMADQCGVTLRETLLPGPLLARGLLASAGRSHS